MTTESEHRFSGRASFLETVRDTKRRELSLLDEMPFLSPPEPASRDFRKALCRCSGALSLIAEIKPVSPALGDLCRGRDLVELARKYAAAGARALSVLTDSHHFGGSLELLSEIRREVPLPILAKDFFVSRRQIDQARRAGADAILLIASLPEEGSLESLVEHAFSLGMQSLVEVHDETELERALSTRTSIIGVNARNLRTLEIDPGLHRKLAPKIPRDRIAVAESSIASREDVLALKGKYDAVLIGTALMNAGSPQEKIRELFG